MDDHQHLQQPALIGRAGCALLAALICSYIVFVASELAGGYAAARQGDNPRYTDFTSLYAASILVQRQAAADLYRPREMFRATVDAAHAAYGPELTEAQARRAGYAPWMYPPHFIFVTAPLAHLPYLPAFLAWMLTTGLLLFAAVRHIVPSTPVAALAAFAAPPAFFNLAYGQTGFLSGGLIGMGLALLRQRPLVAGVCIGLASVKPHLGLLIPFALVAGGHWRTFLSASITVLALVALSVWAYGDDPWFGFIGTSLSHMDGFRVDAYTWSSMSSVLAAGHLVGLSLDTAWRLQALATLFCIGGICTVWWRGRHQPATLPLQAAVLCLATPLAVPMAYLYDLCAIIPALAWLRMDMRGASSTAQERILLMLMAGALLPAFLAASRLSLPLGTIATLGLLVLAARRFAQRLGNGGQPAD